MKRLFLLLPLLFLFSGAHAQQQRGNPVVCDISSGLACLPGVQIGTGTTGMPAWQSFGTLNTNTNVFNANFSQLYSMFGSSSHLLQNGSASASDITGLFSGVCSATSILFGNGACANLASANIPPINLGSSANGGVTGNLPVTNLNGGTNANVLSFWRGDGSWNALVSADIPPINLSSSANGGAVIPRTAVEISAGVTPVNASYPVLNVMRYGSDPTGTASSSTAFANAVAVAAHMLNGGQIYIPPGIYLQTSTVNVGDNQNIYFRGAGPNASIIKASSGMGNVLQWGNTFTQFGGIEDLGIDCSLAHTTCTGVNLFNVVNFFASRFSIQQANIGIVENEGGIHFWNQFVINNDNAVGILITGNLQGTNFTDGLISNYGGTNATVAGIELTNCGGANLTNIDILLANNGVLFNPGNGQSVMWSFFVNVQADTGAGAGMIFAPTGTGTVYGTTCTECWTGSNGADGVSFAATSGTVDEARFIGHRAFRNAVNGFNLASTNATNIAIQDSDISGNSNPAVGGTSGIASGISVSPGVSGFQIQNSRIGQENNQGNTQKYGVIVGAGSSNNYTIKDNDLRTNVTANLSDAGTGTSKIVSDNIGYNPIGSKSISVSTGTFTWPNNTGSPVVVSVSGGTVTAISAAGNTVSNPSSGGFFTIPQGQTIVVVNTGVPTMSYYGIN